nr:Leucine-rich repeat domain containing protein [Haemonchus contortus]
MILFCLLYVDTVFANCPKECQCETDTVTVTCSGPQVLTLPDVIPPGFEVLVIRNASIRSIPKHAFRRMDRLREIHVEHCNQLTFLEKFAFKGMKKLRLISFTNCPRLNEIPKASFSGIGNDFGVKIQFHRTPVQRVHSGAFRHAHNIRELSISGSDLALSRHAFASINQLDFLTVTGVTVIEPQLFTNSTRFHIVHLKDLNCEIPPRAFEDLAHVHQVLIQRSKIATISTDAFTGLSTVETVELFDNQIGMIAARAFASIINLGRIRIARNHIETLQTVESLLSTAIQTRIEENTIECGCDLQWMTVYEDRRAADVNYCGASGVHRTVRSYLRQFCHRPHPTALSTLSSSETSFVVTNHDRMLGQSLPPSIAAHYSLSVYTIVPIIGILLLL